jgi:mRNA interferase MazF
MLKHKIVLVPFPFDDLSSSKVRPAVCLTNAIGPHQHVVLAFITSRVPIQPLPSDVVVEPTSPEFDRTGLRVPSTIQLHRLITVTTALLRRELGIVPSVMQAEVDQRLRQLFELT